MKKKNNLPICKTQKKKKKSLPNSPLLMTQAKALSDSGSERESLTSVFNARWSLFDGNYLGCYRPQRYCIKDKEAL